MKRQGNNPKRRVVPAGSLDERDLETLASNAFYAGSGHHKRYPADYGLERTNPRPTKSLCDGMKDLSLEKARQLFFEGIKAGMVSKVSEKGFPKFIWSVNDDGTVYEATTDPKNPGAYHGYPLEIEDDFRTHVLEEWKKR